MSVGLSGQHWGGNLNHSHYHLLSNYSITDTELNNFKYIISVNLHDNPKWIFSSQFTEETKAKRANK